MANGRKPTLIDPLFSVRRNTTYPRIASRWLAPRFRPSRRSIALKYRRRDQRPRIPRGQTVQPLRYGKGAAGAISPKRALGNSFAQATTSRHPHQIQPFGDAAKTPLKPPEGTGGLIAASHKKAVFTCATWLRMRVLIAYEPRIRVYHARSSHLHRVQSKFPRKPPAPYGRSDNPLR